MSDKSKTNVDPAMSGSELLRPPCSQKVYPIEMIIAYLGGREQELREEHARQNGCKQMQSILTGQILEARNIKRAIETGNY